MVGRVRDGEEAVGAEPVGEEVVQHAAVLVAEHGVLRAALGDPRHVVGEQALEQRERAGAGRLDLAHVADVEDAGAVAHGRVLVADARCTAPASPSRRTAPACAPAAAWRSCSGVRLSVPRRPLGHRGPDPSTGAPPAAQPPRPRITFGGAVGAPRREERLDDHGELRPGAAAQLVQRRARRRARRAYGRGRSSRRTRRRPRRSARPSGISSAGEPVRVAAAVPALVAGAHERRDAGERRRGGDDPLADERVAADERPLVLVERPRLG